MKLVYVISKYTKPNSNYKLHIPNPHEHGQPVCGRMLFTIEFTEGERPTCKNCLKVLSMYI